MAPNAESRLGRRAAARSTRYRCRRSRSRGHPRPNCLWRLQLMRFWRICRRRHASEAATGEGASLVGGRWNRRGMRVVYASTSLALAAVETFVNLEPNLRPPDLVSIQGEIPDAIGIAKLDLTVLLSNWHETRDESLRPFGDDWIRHGRSAALLVPSA